MAHSSRKKPTGINSIATAGSVTGDGVGIAVQLVNDQVTPGNSRYYGTSATGAKGFYATTAALSLSPTGQLVATVNGVASAPINLGSVVENSNGTVDTTFNGVIANSIRTIGEQAAATAAPSATDVFTMLIGGNHVKVNLNQLASTLSGLLPDVKLSSGAYNATTKALDFTLSNGSIVSVPVAALLPVQSANSITGDGATTQLQLVGDSAAPGASRYYGTNAAGTKGYFALISTNAISLDSSGQLVSTVNGVATTPLVLADFFREQVTNVGPTGSGDVTKSVYHNGNIVVGDVTSRTARLNATADTSDVASFENKTTGFNSNTTQVALDFRGRFWSGSTAVVSQAVVKSVKTAADGSAGTKLVLGVANGGNVVTDQLELLSTGQLKLNAYTTSTSFSGVSVGTLGYDSAGNVVTVPNTAANDFWRSGGGTALPDGTNDTTEAIRRDGLVGLNVNPLTTLDVGGSFSTAYTNASAAAVTAAINDYTINLSLAGAQTLSSAAASGFTRRIEVWRNATAISKTVPTYLGIDGNSYTTIPAFTSVEVQSDGTAWIEIGRSQYGNIGGSIIAMLERQVSQTVLTFDGINFRWNGATDRFEIATAAGTRNVEWVTATLFGAQGTVINGGGGIDGTTQGTPIALTTTYQVIGDPGITGIETRVYHLWDNSTNKHYRINAVRKGTTTTDGWYSASVELVGVTNATPTTAGQGIQIIGNQIQNANRIAANSPLASALTGTQVDLGQFRFRYNANVNNGNLDIQSLTGAAVPFRYYSTERFPSTPLYSGATYNGGLSAPVGSFVTLPALGVGTNELLEWDIITAANHYFVKISNFQDTNVNIIVEKAV